MDANETWLVLGVGVLLIAFPMAHGIILTELYLPVGIMLAGLILRGVSFDFRAKAHLSQKAVWNFLFFFGSFLAAASQGVMVGREVIGFDSGYLGWIFSFIVALCLPAGYALLYPPLLDEYHFHLRHDLVCLIQLLLKND